jgi:hypothetical protein
MFSGGHILAALINGSLQFTRLREDFACEGKWGLRPSELFSNPLRLRGEFHQVCKIIQKYGNFKAKIDPKSFPNAGWFRSWRD